MEDPDFDEEVKGTNEIIEDIPENLGKKMDVHYINLFIEKLESYNNRTIESALIDILRIPLNNYLEPKQFPITFRESILKVFQINHKKIINLASQFLLSLVKYNSLFLTQIAGSVLLSILIPKLEDFANDEKTLFYLLELCSWYTTSNPITQTAYQKDVAQILIKHYDLSHSKILNFLLIISSSKYFVCFEEEEQILTICSSIAFADNRPPIEEIDYSLRIMEKIIKKNPTSNFVTFLENKNDLFKPISLITESQLVLDSSLLFYMTISEISDAISKMILDEKILEKFIESIQPDNLPIFKRFIFSVAQTDRCNTCTAICNNKMIEIIKLGYELNADIRFASIYILCFILCEVSDYNVAMAVFSDSEITEFLNTLYGCGFSDLFGAVIRSVNILYERGKNQKNSEEFYQFIKSDELLSEANEIASNENSKYYKDAIFFTEIYDQID
ncbi:hypothetical protein TVAG_332200 [Trichomonas vaginalis G3]|uniref:Uncharacterized protein n=1 Tax=Trichomonas vaginalis (strain ATCC PRA-98 / G3) TaxID=412133 RepID=A2G8Y2_TRIV3|nr:armadillo (ARM) repeat-containing protein family [Trichomonas vaginalis G3]EAX86384.1 hypothetical protein TVAG_332200 [Trichomonas vaginalis G3]KAI5508554.1 armadillo (ARM) repeat-containing protein family [Trichomonas vaginalis G3]|eukprot:XP_001299314.1 hypothetical protein [Trichomonas vaginalis G3]